MFSPHLVALLNRIASDAANHFKGCDGKRYGHVQAFLYVIPWLRDTGKRNLRLQGDWPQSDWPQSDWLHGDRTGISLQNFGLRDRALLLQSDLATGLPPHCLLSMGTDERDGATPSTLERLAATRTSCVCHRTGIFVRAIQGIRVFLGDGDRHPRSGIVGWRLNYDQPIPTVT